MNKSNEFLKNTVLLFLGKFSTQFISLLLLPIFTRYLLTEDYGLVDLIQSYVALLFPILSLRLDSVSFRFLIDCRNDKNKMSKVVTNISLILCITSLLVLISGFLLNSIVDITYYWLSLFTVIVLMSSSVFMQLLRGIGQNLQYSIASVITAFSNLVVNIILIVFFNVNASSILYAAIVSNIICIFYVILVSKIWRLISIKHHDYQLIKEMLSYSIPMIPNALSWWIVSVSDRTIISLFLGVSFNAIYAVSGKFSNILNSFYNIVNMSWQETATLQIDAENSEQYFSKMINNLFFIFASVSLLIIAVLPFIYTSIIGLDYKDSYQYIPILLYSNNWNVLSGLIGGIYVAKKQTKEIARTTIVSSVFNLVINFMLIKNLGLYAACISTLLSQFGMSVYRYFDCQRFVKIKLNTVQIIVYTFLFLFVSLLYLKPNLELHIVSLIVAVTYTFFINRDSIKYMYFRVTEKLMNR